MLAPVVPLTEHPKTTISTKNNQLSFLTVFESLADGVLILTEEGELLHANSQARQLCQQLSSRNSPPLSIPQEIWHLCQSLLESRDLFPDRRFILESEVVANNSKSLRLRVCWLDWQAHHRPCLLVNIEDSSQARQNQWRIDSKRYGLTRREEEVWLLRCSGYSYQNIAENLHISINTVKKHLKNIYSKRGNYPDTN